VIPLVASFPRAASDLLGLSGGAGWGHLLEV
jgi:hypothetical protein